MENLLHGTRLGRRGAALLFFAGLDLIYAFSLVNPDPETQATSQFVWLAGVLPLWVWATTWAVTGVMCLVYAFRRDDRWGFTAAVTHKVCWGLVSFGGWLLGGVDRGYVVAAIWLAFAGFVSVVSSWPEADGGETTWTTPPSS